METLAVLAALLVLLLVVVYKLGGSAQREEISDAKADAHERMAKALSRPRARGRELVNRLRKRAGLPPLSEDERGGGDGVSGDNP